MRLYHHPMSFNARRAVMTALHLGAPVELVHVDLAKGEQKAPELVKHNPNGRVPLLVDGDFSLWESCAIQQYLADSTPGQTVYPTEVRARADVNRWLFFTANHLGPSVSILGWERLIKRILNAGDPDPAMEARGEAQVLECTRVLDAHLAGKSWLSGDRVTLADLAAAPPFMMAGPARLPLSDRPNLQRWLDRVQALDAWKKTSL